MTTNEQAAIDHLVMLLHTTIHKAQEIDSKPKTFDTGMPLSRSEIHTVQAIGRDEGCTLKALAGRLDITKGGASQMVAKLVGKGLVAKGNAPGSEKEVALTLTDLGWRAYHAHERFHGAVADAFRAYYGTDVVDRVTPVSAALSELLEVIDLYARMTADS